MRRKWLLRFMAAGLSLMLLEGISTLVWWLEIPGMSLGFVWNNRPNIVTTRAVQSHPTEAIHPYLGWVLNPDLHPAQAVGDRTFSVNRFGLVDDGDTVYKRRADQFLVGIAGGSVAQQMSLMSDAILRSRLEAAPELQGRTVRFVRLALSGHKQPQQLMALSYLLALGGELDVLINVDGFNEVALTITENANFGVAVSYPRSWHHRLQDVVDPRVDSHSYELLRLKVARRRAARLMEETVLRYSPTANLLWATYDRWIDGALVSLGVAVREHRQKHGHGFAKDGPADHFQSEDEKARAVCDLWKNSSRQLHGLCLANRIVYVHVLQPNQHLEGSKPLSALEKEKFYAPEERFAAAIRNIYPLLRTAGEGLRDEGIAFHDGTQLFADETDTLYTDYFCHYNQKGNDLLAEAVVQQVLGQLRIISPPDGHLPAN